MIFCFQNVNSLFQITLIVKGNCFLFRGIQEAVTLVGARTYFIYTCLEFSSTQGYKYTQPRGFFIFYYTTCIYSFVFSGSLCVYICVIILVFEPLHGIFWFFILFEFSGTESFTHCWLRTLCSIYSSSPLQWPSTAKNKGYECKLGL